MGKNRYFRTLNPWYRPYQPVDGAALAEDDVLLFESRFESGNLKKVIQMDRNEYELILKPDYGTRNYT